MAENVISLRMQSQALFPTLLTTQLAHLRYGTGTKYLKNIKKIVIFLISSKCLQALTKQMDSSSLWVS